MLVIYQTETFLVFQVKSETLHVHNYKCFYYLYYLRYNLAVSEDSNCCRKCLSMSTVNDVPFAPLIASVGMLEYD